MVFSLASQTSTSFSAYELISGKSLGASYWYLNWSIAQVYEGCDTEAGSIGNVVHLALNSYRCSRGTRVLAGHGLAAPPTRARALNAAAGVLLAAARPWAAGSWGS